ncbi:hypothetical protein X741_17405 [Mesorhizobium sp. LNHC229A00]|nr:hypothetical protein X741_17405 [Mesorhizobium sp. LNHC229A00]
MCSSDLIRPARIADQHFDTGGEAAIEERHHPQGDTLPVEHVAGEHQIHGGRWPGGDVVPHYRDRDAIGRCIQRQRGNAVPIDLGGHHRTRAGLRGGNADDAGACSKVEHAAARHDLRMVQHIARQHGAACPRIGPIGRLRLLRIGIIVFDKTPQPAARVGGIKPDFGKCRH